ncbi:hypothetical protein B0T21DRAFT_426751 [Apiosordaria backusii]|uniref:Uncharacterized protein n=1 Tax=Apiosordaria backusii TaxID=314023 RepID=A0AA40AEM5_9PEZI|nr:hypothetical protein B0T21DRAFT_426751 [Apiosordaria backusii]
MPKLLSVYKQTWETFRPWAIPRKPLPQDPFPQQLFPNPPEDESKNLVPDNFPEVAPLNLLIPYYPERQTGKELAIVSPIEPSPSASPEPTPSPSNNKDNRQTEHWWRRHRILVLAIAIVIAGATISGLSSLGSSPQDSRNNLPKTNPPKKGMEMGPMTSLSTLPLIVTRTIRGTTEKVTLTKTKTRTQTPRARTTTSAGFDVVVTTPAPAGADGEGVAPTETPAVSNVGGHLSRSFR